MNRQYIFLFLVAFFFSNTELFAQQHDSLSVQFVKNQLTAAPGEVLNIAFFINNNSTSTKEIEEKIVVPPKWNIINHSNSNVLKPSSKLFSLFSIQAPANCIVDNYQIEVTILNNQTKEVLTSASFRVSITEIEKITIEKIKVSEDIIAGENITAKYIIKNSGNTTKKILLETRNCDIKGESKIELKPDESKIFTIEKQTMPDITESRYESYSVRAYESTKLVESIFQSVLVFPQKDAKKDPFFRFPVKASLNYLATNQNDKYDYAFQYQISGEGSLDVKEKHKLKFLSRGPNNIDLSYLGLYDQHFISYSNKNLFVFLGQQSYGFTQLTEMSRFGTGAETRVMLNNGLSVGFVYVKPRYFIDIKNEFSAYSNFSFNKNNSVGVHFVQKNTIDNEPVTLASFTSKIQPFKKTLVELEVSTGEKQGKRGNAFMTNISSQFSIFQVSGNYTNTGKYYPGYYNNSVFYNGNISARINDKISLGVFARQDFANAELDTFFVTAPFTRSIRTTANYSINRNASLMVYWRNFERKDRLSKNKFHYNTKSINAEYNQRLKKFQYMVLGEYGVTTNYFLAPEENRQFTYRGSTNLAYQFNSSNAIKIFGSYSNINSFVASEQRNITAGVAFNTRIGKSLFVDFYFQNAYDIDYYYRNRNLMQLNLNYIFLKHHSLDLKSFYTIFKEEVENPELNISLTYTYKFGIPVKRLINAGELNGTVLNSNGEPFAGLIIYVKNKSTITDSDGKFRVKSIQPGNYILSVDRSKLDIDEMIDIPAPVKIEIFENRTSTINFKIVKGAKLSGKFVATGAKNNILETIPNYQNIIFELKSNFKTYRLTPDNYGKFSFPVLLPGNWTFKIYKNSIPAGFTIKKTMFNLNLKPNDKREMNIIVEKKVKHIIFKNSAPLTPKMPNKETDKTVHRRNKEEDLISGIYYSVQIGAFKKQLNPENSFFKGEKFYFEKEINNLHKYFIGKYKTREEAKREKKRLDRKFKHTIIVTFKNGIVLQ